MKSYKNDMIRLNRFSAMIITAAAASAVAARKHNVKGSNINVRINVLDSEEFAAILENKWASHNPFDHDFQRWHANIIISIVSKDEHYNEIICMVTMTVYLKCYSQLKFSSLNKHFWVDERIKNRFWIKTFIHFRENIFNNVFKFHKISLKNLV